MSAPFTQNFTEGPSVLKLGDEWIIYFDAYQEEHYGAANTSDFKIVQRRNKRSFLSQRTQARHGVAECRKQLDRLLSAGSQP